MGRCSRPCFSRAAVRAKQSRPRAPRSTRWRVAAYWCPTPMSHRRTAPFGSWSRPRSALGLATGPRPLRTFHPSRRTDPEGCTWSTREPTRFECSTPATDMLHALGGKAADRGNSCGLESGYLCRPGICLDRRSAMAENGRLARHASWRGFPGDRLQRGQGQQRRHGRLRVRSLNVPRRRAARSCSGLHREVRQVRKRERRGRGQPFAAATRVPGGRATCRAAVHGPNRRDARGAPVGAPTQNGPATGMGHLRRSRALPGARFLRSAAGRLPTARHGSAERGRGQKRGVRGGVCRPTGTSFT